MDFFHKMCNWKGTFVSTHYTPYVAKGNVSLWLKDEKQDSSYTTDITMVYTGFFQSGQVFSYKGFIKEDEMTIPYAGITLKVTKRTNDVISGTYKRSQPLDFGNFIIYRQGSNEYDKFDNQSSWSTCLIL